VSEWLYRKANHKRRASKEQTPPEWCRSHGLLPGKQELQSHEVFKARHTVHSAILTRHKQIRPRNAHEEGAALQKCPNHIANMVPNRTTNQRAAPAKETSETPTTTSRSWSADRVYMTSKPGTTARTTTTHKEVTDKTKGGRQMTRRRHEQEHVGVQVAATGDVDTLPRLDLLPRQRAAVGLCARFTTRGRAYFVLEHGRRHNIG